MDSNKILDKKEFSLEHQLSRVAYLHLFFANLIRDKESDEVKGLKQTKKLRSLSHDVREYIDEHYGEDLSIQFLAEKWEYTVPIFLTALRWIRGILPKNIYFMSVCKMPNRCFGGQSVP